MKRFWILLVVLFVGAAAPARAWCEATCIAPVHASQPSHCPSHEQPQPDGPVLSAAGAAQCPVIETARPAPAKVELGLSSTIVPSHASHSAPRHLSAPAPLHQRGSGFFERFVPLRI